MELGCAYNTAKRTMRILLVIFSVLTIYSCKSEEEKQKGNLQVKISNAWQLVDQAANYPEIEMNVPLGFTLGATSKDFNNHCDDLIKKNGGRKDHNVYINTTVFGGIKREVRVMESYFFSDPNTETDTIAEISFIFDEFRKVYDKDVVKQFLCEVDSMFDSSWETAEFQLELDSTRFDDYNKFWIKNNMVVRFEYDHNFPMLTFYNIPKSTTRWMKEDIKLSLDIQEEISKKDYGKPKIKISNSPWDGSVYQVEKYLKANLKDPDSYEGMEWGKVIENNSNFIVRHKYRARNSFGGYVVEEYIFTLNIDGIIIAAKKVK